ncbi:DUF4352 domain-containing protein [Shouchella clausii]|jgi:hypothetical protein|nr:MULTISPECIES: DUF4352 domain-containing protein [Shouchella]ALA52199.1 hypothetical protein DB29_01371 [Shouchella clausii]KKI86861.1 hypothetical protein WZ76_08005 [Shouchella clausii]MBU3230360.1 DUF4352 domain-containing protein [Shouchella clausii]MBU3262441.1 DUF4352 domain-containing protein [Shouchella clausii]MBU3507244.1 DUF4352 domain-containing protein [Shouchella clausii]
MKKYMTLSALVLASTLALAACGDEADISASDSNTDAEAEETNTDKESEDNSETEAEDGAEVDEGEEVSGFQIGDEVNFNDLSITVNSVDFSEGSEWEQPSKDKYAYIDITVVNNGDEDYTLSSLMQFELVTNEGRSQDITIVSDQDGELDGTIGAGRTMAGQVVFDVSEADYYELIFEEILLSGQAIWEIPNE